MNNGEFGLPFRRLRSLLGTDLRLRLQHRPTAEGLAKGDRVPQTGPGDQAREGVLPDFGSLDLRTLGASTT